MIERHDRNALPPIADVDPDASGASRADDLYSGLAKAYNAGDLEALLSFYEAKATFVFKPGRVTQGSTQLREAMKHVVDLRGCLTVNPQNFIRHDNLILVLGDFSLSGRRGDGTPFERTSRFVDVLRRQPNGSWLIAIDNPNGGD